MPNTDLAVARQLPLVFVPAPAEIQLTRGQVALVDAGDEEWVRQWRWHARRIRHNWYASRTQYTAGQPYTLYLHAAIWERHNGPVPEGLLIDHSNRHGLDNRITNLRLAETWQNNVNARARGRSKYRGVCYLRARGRWRARIKLHGVSYWLGYHDTEEEAARAYDARAVELFGEFARLNFPHAREEAA